MALLPKKSDSKDAPPTELADLGAAAMGDEKPVPAPMAAAIAKPAAPAAPPKPKQLFQIGADCKFSVHGQMVKLHKGRIIDPEHFHPNWIASAKAAGADLQPVKA